MYEHRHRPSLVWPIILIGAGILFLLNNLGMVDWDIWLTIGRLWPLILVAMGLDIILGRSTGIWPAIAVLLIIALFASGVWLARTTGSVFSGELITQEFSHPLEDATNAKIDVNFGIGQLNISENSDESILAKGMIRLTDSELFQSEYRSASGTAYILFDSHGQQFYPSWWFGESQHHKRDWEIYLTQEIPIGLNVDMGVGRAILNLRQLQITELDVDCGVGETILYLPDNGEFSAYIDGGVGQIKVYIPEILSVRIIVESGLGNISVMGDYDQSGNVYTGTTYEESSERVNVYVNGGVGNISIIQSEH